MDLTIGVDVGGTKIAAGAVDASGHIVEKVRVSTPATTAEAVEEAIVEAVRRLVANHDIAAVGLAVPGFVDEKRATLRFTPNLPMVDRPLREIVGRAGRAPRGGRERRERRGLGRAPLRRRPAEPRDGARHRRHGLGGGIVARRRLLRGAFGVAAEFGHMRVVPGGPALRLRQPRLLGAVLLGRRAAAAGPRRCAGRTRCAARRLLELAGDDPAALTGPMVAEAALAGDPAAVGLFAEHRPLAGRGRRRRSRPCSTRRWSSSAAASARPATCCWTRAGGVRRRALRRRAPPAPARSRCGRAGQRRRASSARPTCAREP